MLCAGVVCLYCHHYFTQRCFGHFTSHVASRASTAAAIDAIGNSVHSITHSPQSESPVALPPVCIALHDCSRCFGCDDNTWAQTLYILRSNLAYGCRCGVPRRLSECGMQRHESRSSVLHSGAALAMLVLKACHTYQQSIKYAHLRCCSYTVN